VSAKIGKMIETLLLSVLIIAIAAILLGVKVIFRKNGTFSSMHIHDSEAMRERGIHCVIDQDREQRGKKQAVKEMSK
jgi:phosphotransferase system  glucose/maltose/N-acetylglucosamine-specific IIC component